MEKRLHILAVGDDPNARERLVTLLRREGHRVSVAADGHQACGAVVRDCPDVVLLDVGLEGPEGYGVVRRLKEARQEKPPFVIAATDWPEDDESPAEAGVDLHLPRPIDPAELGRVLARFGRLVEPSESVPLAPFTVRPRR